LCLCAHAHNKHKQAVAVASGASRFLAAQSYRPSFNVGPGSWLPILRSVDEKEEHKLVERLENGNVDIDDEAEGQSDDGVSKAVGEDMMPGAIEDNEDKSAAPERVGFFFVCVLTTSTSTPFLILLPSLTYIIVI
jgi:hypothetical protein